jgi:hypothetical protein
MTTGVLLDMLVVSPLLSSLQGWLSWSIVGHLRRTLPLLRDDFLDYYRGACSCGM